MNKLILYTYILLGCLFVSCNDSIDESVNERTSFNADLYFETYGFQTAKTTTLVNEFRYILKIKNKDSEALHVTLKIDEQVLNEYNSFHKTDYKMLPAAYYNLTESLDLNAVETSVPIVLNIKKIVDELGLEASLNYVIPIKLKSNNVETVNSDVGSQALVHVAISMPTIVFDENVLNLAIDDTVAKPVVQISAKYDFDNLDVSKVTIQANMDKVATYNAANNTNYLNLPLGSYSYQSIVVDESKHQLTINYLINPKLIDIDPAGSYMLPIDFSSSEYDFAPDSIIYLDIKFNPTKPVYEGVFDLVTNQPPTNDYSAYPVDIDLANAATLLKTTEAELRDNITLWGIKTDGINFVKEYTADAPGFWFNKDKNPDFYSDKGLLYVNYSIDEGKFYVGQFPEAATSGGNYTVSLVLVYNGLMVKYNITLNTN
ncbi:BT_3987 domain-containing protein [Flavobacterium sp. XS2P39]|uniref:BT_3987 domain-containing protein n=1 Tax=Flavobacterium sp. XS2P39 TaxID=3401725 RepID=UPI003AAA6793